MAGHVVAAQLLSLHYSRLDDMDRLLPLQASSGQLQGMHEVIVMPHSPEGATNSLQVFLHKRHNVAAARKVSLEARAMLGNAASSDATDIIQHSLNCDQIFASEESDGLAARAIGSALTGLSGIVDEQN